MATLADVIAVLEVRICIETEAAALAAHRSTEDNLRVMRAALDEFLVAVRSGHDAVVPDFRFHLEIARATQNRHYAELVRTLGTSMIPMARLDAPVSLSRERREFLRRVHDEHESIFDAITALDGDGAQRCAPT